MCESAQGNKFGYHVEEQANDVQTQSCAVLVSTYLRLSKNRVTSFISSSVLRLPQTGAKYTQRQRKLRCEFCRGLERTRRQVAVPTLARKNRADVCETAAIYSLSLFARFFVAVAAYSAGFTFQFRELAPAGDKNVLCRQAPEGRSREVSLLIN